MAIACTQDDYEPYLDMYAVGWDSIRMKRFGHQKELGIIASYVNGTGTIPLKKYLSEAGFKVSVVNGAITLMDDPAANKLQLEMQDGFFGKIAQD